MIATNIRNERIEDTVVIENISETIKRELPALLRSDPDLRRYILELARETCADRQ